MRNKIVLLSLLAFIVISLLYSWKKGGDLLFDMKEVIGQETNNPYGIRNDVYDFFKKESENPENVEFKDPSFKNLLLNFMKIDQLLIKNFSNKSLSIKLTLKSLSIIGCEKIRSKYFSNKIIGPSYQKSFYTKVFLNTKDRETVYRIADSHSNEVNLNILYKDSKEESDKKCNKMSNEILSDTELEEF